jgi:hypothetical protein
MAFSYATYEFAHNDNLEVLNQWLYCSHNQTHLPLNFVGFVLSVWPTICVSGRLVPSTQTEIMSDFRFTQRLKKKKLRGFSPQANYTDQPSNRSLPAKLVPTLADRGVLRGQRNGSPRP